MNGTQGSAKSPLHDHHVAPLFGGGNSVSDVTFENLCCYAWFSSFFHIAVVERDAFIYWEP